MNRTPSELTAVGKSNSVYGQHSGGCKENGKNGIVNGVVHNKKHKKHKKLKCVDSGHHERVVTELKDSIGLYTEENITEHQSDYVNNVDRSKDKEKKIPKLDDLNCNKSVIQDNLDKSIDFKSGLDNGPSEVEASCSQISDGDVLQLTSDVANLIIKEEYPKSADQCCDKKIEFVQYQSELQMPMIMKIIQKDLSEPYSIYTYRYFIHNWPKLCFLAMYEQQCVGAIVCKLDLHRKVIKRGYIAMLAVDQNFRKLKIGSTLVQMAIHEMTLGDADEVVLETEVTNKPALKLYEKLGFVRDKRLFRYYLNGVDALRLKLWLR
ncbi:N-alpha-acetyltransferase 30-like [Cylas formicarius]|uniref:N-alpha-acetyltransferase 30-like n=1 Tax=Cylas formicarius TaxID=197179 RepID=UPI002958B852|nr:N-alpha-acetyltransferase 30-like [Cylas formicarius]